MQGKWDYMLLAILLLNVVTGIVSGNYIAAVAWIVAAMQVVIVISLKAKLYG